MLGLIKSTAAPHNDHAACSGCSLCLLVCPVWRETRDLRLTPHGRAKALQHGAGIDDIAASIESCTLCAACEPVCPEQIDLVGLVINLRRQLARADAPRNERGATNNENASPANQQPASRTALLAGHALRAHPAILARVAALLKSRALLDDAADIALGLETGANFSAARLERFLGPLRGLKRIIVADGLLFRHLRNWLPKSKIVSLGEALSGIAAVRNQLRTADLYVIEPRAYHADYQRLVKYYDGLRAATGCSTNLDLLRIAIPATARSLPQRLGLTPVDDTTHAQWILHGRKITRIVVESVEDIAAFAPISMCPVVHLAELAGESKSPPGTYP